MILFRTWRKRPHVCRIQCCDETRRSEIRVWIAKRSNSSDSAIFRPDPSLVDARHAPADYDPSCAVVYPDFVTDQEANVLAEEVKSRMKRRRYERGTGDAVITGYKEVEMHEESFPDSTIPDIFQRTRQHLGEHHLDHHPVQWLPCHAIDLKKEGELKAHVDSIRFSGGLVAGISLLSSSIMRLIPDNGDDDNVSATELTNPEDDEDRSHVDRAHVDLFLPPNSLYVLTGDGRYKYSHELLPDSSTFTSPSYGSETVVKRDHRLSIIFRDAKRAED